jgi:hypothetical protein
MSTPESNQTQFTMGKPMPESNLTLCHVVDFIPAVRDFGFGLRQESPCLSSLHPPPMQFSIHKLKGTFVSKKTSQTIQPSSSNFSIDCVRNNSFVSLAFLFQSHQFWNFLADLSIGISLSILALTL